MPANHQKKRNILSLDLMLKPPPLQTLCGDGNVWLRGRLWYRISWALTGAISYTCDPNWTVCP